MKYGLFGINYGTCADPDHVVVVARHAEDAGFESVWTGEHLVLPDPQLERFSMPPNLAFLDTIVGLTLVAAETRSLQVASGIIQLPLHYPVILARQLASVDRVARGRLIVGVAAGYLETEFLAMGIPLSDRAWRMEEHLDVLQALWKCHDRSFLSVGKFRRGERVSAPCPRWRSTDRDGRCQRSRSSSHNCARKRLVLLSQLRNGLERPCRLSAAKSSNKADRFTWGRGKLL